MSERREHETYRETYRKPWPLVTSPNRRPNPGCLAKGVRVVETRLMAAGRVRRASTELEYLDVRFYTVVRP